MQRILRLASLVLVVLAGVSGVAVAVLYAFAVNSLAASGPNLTGYNLLSAANRSVPWVAVLAVLAVCAAFARSRVVMPAVTLAVAGVLVGGLALGARSLALFLYHVDQHAQPAALDSFILAIAGSAHDVSPAALVLLVGALVLAGIRGLAVLRERRARALVSATA